MRITATNWCLTTATITFVLAAPHGVQAQDEAADQLQPQEQASQEELSEQAPSREPSRRLFVDDKVVLNVYSEPAQGGERVATIETGDAVGELDRADNFVLVRLDDGREGWVGANYLTADPPAALQLRELQRAQKSAAAVVEKKSADDAARLRKQNAALTSELEALKARAAENTPVPDAAPAEQIEETHEELSAPPQPDSSKSGAFWLALFAALASGGAGFAVGYQTLAQRIRKKFGGLKIY